MTSKWDNVMMRELTPNEIVFRSPSFEGDIKQTNVDRIPEITTTLNKIKKSFKC